MSFDISLQIFENKGLSKFPRSIVWDKIAPYATRDGIYWNVRFSDRSGGLVNLDDDDQITGFSVNRPSDGIFYDVLVEIMKEVPILLTWGEGYCVADASIVAGFPEFLLQAIETPPVVHNGKELQECLLTYEAPVKGRP